MLIHHLNKDNIKGEVFYVSQGSYLRTVHSPTYLSYIQFNLPSHLQSFAFILTAWGQEHAPIRIPWDHRWYVLENKPQNELQTKLCLTFYVLSMASNLITLNLIFLLPHGFCSRYWSLNTRDKTKWLNIADFIREIGEGIGIEGKNKGWREGRKTNENYFYFSYLYNQGDKQAYSLLYCQTPKHARC